MTRTTGATTERRRGLSSFPVRVRITAVLALLATAALAGAGLIVYVVETGRVEASVEREVEQEFDEFALLREDGIDPATGKPFDNVPSLLRTFLERNVPDDDELLVGWVGDAPRFWFPNEPLVGDRWFLEAARPLVAEGGTSTVDTADGRIRISAQPVIQGEARGALVVVAYLDEDMAELRDTMRTYAVVAALSLALVTAVAFWQSGRLLRPLRTLRQTADEISATDLSRRIPVTGNDDISDLTRTINGMLDRLQSAFVVQRQFLDDAGHELRTPLTVLRGHLELLDTDDPAETADTRELLLDETDRMARLVGDLILLAKSDRPDFITRRPVDVAVLTGEVLAKARALGERAWSLDAAATVRVPLDEQRITQALLQLCDNAVKHTSPGDTVAIGSTYAAGRLSLWVRDTGHGVAPEHRIQIFQRFGRAHVPAGDEGFGLGLSIVSAIAAGHGGTVRVEDSAPHGATFVITIPRSEHEEPPWHAS